LRTTEEEFAFRLRLPADTVSHRLSFLATMRKHKSRLRTCQGSKKATREQLAILSSVINGNADLFLARDKELLDLEKL